MLSDVMIAPCAQLHCSSVCVEVATTPVVFSSVELHVAHVNGCGMFFLCSAEFSHATKACNTATVASRSPCCTCCRCTFAHCCADYGQVKSCVCTDSNEVLLYYNTS
eukprot:3754-Heterococcus_DN1.PRE.2